MVWSFTHSKTFRRCARQWYYKHVMANARAKRQAIRNEAYLLSKLDSLWAWRGRLVDTVISRFLIPELRRGRVPERTEMLRIARRLYDAQLTFALEHRLREPGVSPSQIGEAFAALRDVEYGTPPSDADLVQAWEDIEAAVGQLLCMRELLNVLQQASHLLPQRNLVFQHDILTGVPVSVRAVPDLMAFFADRPPLIVDWKVHSFGDTDYRLQLALYAVALTRCKPHKDFPPGLSAINATDIELVEAQLLKGTLHTYNLTVDDLEDIDGYIIESATSISLMIEDHEKGDFDPFDVPAMTNPATCMTCNFKKLCWRGPECQQSKQIPIPF
jgi:hypothetical protein